MASLAPFRIGTVLADSLATFRRCFAAYVPVTLVTGIPLLLNQIPIAEGRRPTPADQPIIYTLICLGAVLSFLASAIIQAAVLADLGGGKVGLGPAIGAALRRILPMLAMLILYGLMITFGLILLVIPGIFIWLIYSLALAALLAEPVGVFGAFARSAALTKGNRWRLLGLLLLVIVSVVVILLAITIGVTLIATPVIAAVIGYVWSSIYSAFFSVLLAISYRALVRSQASAA
jgi:hypothetical protein